jgi:phosphopantothenoylcysteine decarboxylase
MANVLLGVTGSVAAIKVPQLFTALKAAGHEVKVVATARALYFFDPAELSPLPGVPLRRNPAVVMLEQDEWPGHRSGQLWQRDDPVLHIDLRRWAELLLIAPLDANTLAKLACGLADNSLTCVWRAWDPARPVVLAPAMNTLMWEHALTRRHLCQLAADQGAPPPPTISLEALPGWINSYCQRLRIVPPVSKVLACGDEGVGALAPVEDIVAAVHRACEELPGSQQ